MHPARRRASIPPATMMDSSSPIPISTSGPRFRGPYNTSLPCTGIPMLTTGAICTSCTTLFTMVPFPIQYPLPVVIIFMCGRFTLKVLAVRGVPSINRHISSAAESAEVQEGQPRVLVQPIQAVRQQLPEPRRAVRRPAHRSRCVRGSSDDSRLPCRHLRTSTLIRHERKTAATRRSAGVREQP